jgi:hypothetical protein
MNSEQKYGEHVSGVVAYTSVMRFSWLRMGSIEHSNGLSVERVGEQGEPVS